MLSPISCLYCTFISNKLTKNKETKEITGVLYLGTMELTDLNGKDYTNTLIGVLKTYVNDISKLIIDVRGNKNDNGIHQAGYLNTWLNMDASEPHSTKSS